MRNSAEESHKYLSKDEMVSDVVFAMRSRREGKLSIAGQRSVLRAVMSAWTQCDGKHKGCRYWSKLAIAVMVEHRRNKKRGWKKRLCHEHVVPKECVMKMLRVLDDPTSEVVRAILSRHLIGAVITTVEDEVLSVYHKYSMPDSFYECADPLGRDPWLRYKQYPEIEIADARSFPPDSEAAMACGPRARTGKDE